MNPVGGAFGEESQKDPVPQRRDGALLQFLAGMSLRERRSRFRLSDRSGGIALQSRKRQRRRTAETGRKLLLCPRVQIVK